MVLFKQSDFEDGTSEGKSSIDLSWARFSQTLSFEGSTIEHGLKARGLHIEDSLRLRDAKVHDGCLDLEGARVEGTLDMQKATLKGGVLARDMHVDKAMRLDAAKMSGGCEDAENVLNLEGAKIAGSLHLNSADISGFVWAPSLRVGVDLWLADATFNHGKHSLSLEGAEIQGALRMDRSAFDGGIEARGVHVAGDLWLVDGAFDVAPDFTGSHVEGFADLSGAKLHGLDLTGAMISRALVMTRPPKLPEWLGNARLILRNTQVGVLLDSPEAWPPKLGDEKRGSVDLQGFVYNRLGTAADTTVTLPNQVDTKPNQGDTKYPSGAEWYKEWLERDPVFTHQPYQQLASVLRASGDPDLADAVLFAARERERIESWNQGHYGNYLLLGMLRRTIHYGLDGGYYLVLGWVLVFTIIGAAVLWYPRSANKGFIWYLWASLDQLLPIVELNKEFGEYIERVEGGKRGILYASYFCFHSIMGYLLASFVVAGLAGLTQTQ